MLFNNKIGEHHYYILFIYVLNPEIQVLYIIKCFATDYILSSNRALFYFIMHKCVLQVFFSVCVCCDVCVFDV